MMRKIFFLSVLILCVQLGFSQTYSDDIIQEAKILENQGWVGVPGQLKIEDQIIKNYELLRLKDNKGEPVYKHFAGSGIGDRLIYSMFMSKSLADTSKKEELKNYFNQLISESNLDIQKQLIVKVALTNSFFQKVLYKTKNETTISIYRDFESCEKSPNAKGKLSEGMVECELRVFCKWEESLTIAKKSLREALIGKLTEDELTKLLGPDSNSTSSDEKFGTFTDPRDGKTYKTVKIGSQVWMAENLAYKPKNAKYRAYDKDNSYVTKYGYLYDWETAKKIAPKGWHLPSEEEWDNLAKYVANVKGIRENRVWDGIGSYLKSTSGWENGGNGNDFFGFNGLPGGDRDIDGSIGDVGKSGKWWCSNVLNGGNSSAKKLYFNNAYWSPSLYDKKGCVSVRLLKD